MAIQYTVVSIGALSRNPFWGETTAVRTAHATTTLIRTGDRKILVDPALPATVLDARLFERTGLHLADIDTVFLTTFRTAHRMGLPALEGARWYIHPAEKDWAKAYLEEMRGRLKKEAPVVDDELALLERCKAPEDKLAEGVELFPSPGASPGGCGLLLTPVTGSVVIAGDAVISQEYLEHGRVWDQSHDLKRAQESLQDILEVADLVIPAHDNILPVAGKLFGV
ncbi:MAG: MBL fold metallo-hydrolase [Phycisphaerae bacterium]|nr:MBL fold metallo-hydrolase [Phycisphaerae bacterium]